MRAMDRISAVALMVRRSLRQHWLGSLVTLLSVALASGLVMAVFSISAQARAAFAGGTLGFDAVLGARGSQLQLVLNTVFHLETSPGNIPWSLYEAIRQDPRVETAIPYVVGDNYLGWRIVGTLPEIFQKAEGLAFAEGRAFSSEGREAVLGSYAAQRTGLKVGDTFKPYHGLYFDKAMQHDEIYTVVGRLKPSNSPSDRVIWTSVDAVYRMKGHVLRGTGSEYEPQAGKAIPDESKEVSAVMLRLKDPMAGFILDQTINKQGKVATLAWPIAAVMADLFERLGWVYRVLGLVAGLVVLVACGSILASLYNALQARRRDLAILRALGAGRRTLSAAILAEAGLLAFLGSLLGYAIYLLILALAASLLRSQTGVVLSLGFWHPALYLAPLGVTLLGLLAGLVPAWSAYATDVAENLKPLS